MERLLYRSGRMVVMGRIPRDQDTRFWEKVDKSGECWVWMAATVGTGYGGFRTRDPRGWIIAHRYAYMRLVGPIPTGLDLDHLCRNRKCVKPEHLEPVTRRENLLRGETMIARQLKSATCKHGHADWRIRPNGYRVCRECVRLRRASPTKRDALT